jgi:death-on-curing family protein
VVWIPSSEYIEVLFNDQIKTGHLINRTGLISTLDKVKWGIPFQDTPTIWDRATILYKEIIECHYFSDGNKRIGSLLVYIFFFKNGYEFSPPKGEVYQITMEVAQGLKEFDEIKEWFKINTKKI